MSNYARFSKNIILIIDIILEMMYNDYNNYVEVIVLKKVKYIKGTYPVEKFSTIREMVDMAAEQAADTEAYKWREGKDDIKSVTYREFRKQTSYLGTALKSIGMADKHINVIGDNSYKYILTYITSLLSEGVSAPVDKELPMADIINVVNHSDGAIIFYAKKFEEKLMENREQFVNIKYFVGFDRTEDEGDFLSFDKFLEKGKEIYEGGDHSFDLMQSDDSALKLLVYTSGTTGIAKGVMLSHHNVVSCVYYGMQVSNIYTTGLSVLPYNHSYEAVCGILVAIHSHVTLCINSSIKQVLPNLMLFRPDYIYLVPAFVDVFYKRIWSTAEKTGKANMLRTLIKVSNGLRKVGIDLRGVLFKSVTKNFGGRLSKIVCGGAPIRAEVGEFFDSIGIILTNGYGISECSPLVSVNRADKTNDCTTVGITLPCIELKFENANEDGDGEICVKGDTVMMGYYKMPELTEEVLKDGWFYTGDYGRYNDKGLLMITGRKKNLIILSNGKNIFPEEIENYILEIPYVKEVVVYGVENEHGIEESLCAQAFLDEEAVAAMGDVNLKEKLMADILRVCDELPAYKKVSHVVIRDTEFEKTTANKIKRNKVEHII